ncbi:TPA: hypothetical protein ACG06N_005124, partial [Klebsiella pneumoniae]
KKSLMPPWWVHHETGSGATSRWSFFYEPDCVGLRQTLAITLYRTYYLVAHLSGASFVLRDGVEPASFPSWLGF